MSGIMNVDDGRKHLFTEKTKSLENLPPTQEVLKQHIKWARYVLVHLLEESPNCYAGTSLPCQLKVEKILPTGWEPLWTKHPKHAIN